MRHLGLFEGIGGFSLAARWMGWETIAWVEIDKFCQKVLKKNFPDAKGYGDIKEFDGSAYRGTVDILTGGFPCQPFSTAGQRKGKEDDRYLWPEMLRVIGEVHPRWIVGENVSGLLNLSGGLVLKQIKIDLETTGYKVIPPIILPACSKNAPHRRDRLWIIAYSTSYFKHYEDRCESISQKIQEKRFDESEAIANTNSERLQRRQNGFKSKEEYESTYQQSERYNKLYGQNWTYFPSQPSVCGRDDGVSNRMDRIKALGNAIVPQVAYEIFKAIEKVKI